MAEMAKRQMAKLRLLDFVKYNYSEYEANWHHKIIAEKLEGVLDGSIKRLIITLPPRHGKSELVSVQFPAWFMGKCPDKSIIASSYGSDLASDFGSQTRNLVASIEYRNIFNEIKLSEDSQAKNNWRVEGHRGRYIATGVGGAITGKGADVLIIDDPLKNRKDADSPNAREDVWKWYTSTARTRLSPDGAVVIIMTRWHDDDLVGRILRGSTASSWDVVNLPAIATHDEQFRKEGEALWATRYSTEALLETKREIGLYEFSALYQQDPVDAESQEFRQQWFKFRTYEDIEPMFTRKFATIDTALSRGAHSDFTGVTRNYVDTSNCWNIRCERYRINSRDLVDLVFKLHDEGFEVIGIEDGAYQQAIKPFLDETMKKRNRFPNVVALKHGGVMKESRIRGLVPRYETGTIYHLTGYCKDLEEELLRFPKSVHDDCMDSLAYQMQVAQPPEEDDSNVEFGLYSTQYR